MNNSTGVNPVIATNDDPLWLGDWAAGGKAANAKLDQVKISSRIVPENELGFHRQDGPAQIIFGDSFESYGNLGDLLSWSGGARNHWKSDDAGPEQTLELTTSHAHSGDQSILMQHLNANTNGNRSSPFYNLPVAATRGEPIVATSGWVSFTGSENVRLFFQNQIWTGDEVHYDVTMTLLAGGIQYWGDTQTWRFEDAPGAGSTTIEFSDPVAYNEDLDSWHYYEFVMDYQQKEYVSFQFDDQLWDLSGNGMLVIPNYTDASVIPVVDHNVRLLELPNPPHPYTAQFALDDAAISVGPRPTADYDDSGVVDVGDLNLVLFNWNEDASSLPATWINARPVGGTLIGVEQLNPVLFNWGAPGSAAAVPEPNSLLLLCCGLAVTVRRKAHQLDQYKKVSSVSQRPLSRHQ